MVKRVLVIEDDRFNRLLYRDLLEGEGWAVLVAADGATGMSYALGENPDLVLVDIQLPDMNGLELTRTLKNTPETAHLPVLVVSAHALAKHRAAAAAAGADAFIRKPFEFAKLVSTVKGYFAEGEAS